MKAATLVFSDSGKTVHIKFANDKESFEFESKEEALFAICDCFNKEKITATEKDAFVKEIILSETLPDHRIKISLVPLILLAAFLGAMDTEEKIIDPDVRICECGAKMSHAHIYNGDGEKIGPPFHFKMDGMVYVESLLKEERITESDSAKLNTLITFLQLPESSMLN